MTYRVGWRLVGCSGRALDSGFLEDVFDAYSAAVAAVDLFMRPYSEVGRDSDKGHWWARRSADADIEMQVWIEDLGESDSETAATMPPFRTRSVQSCEAAMADVPPRIDDSSDFRRF